MTDGPLTVPLGEGRGFVLSFDDPRGLGVVRREDGTEYPFHCTAIADGSRTIGIGTEVVWNVSPGRLGRWEATGLKPAPSGDTLQG